MEDISRVRLSEAVQTPREGGTQSSDSDSARPKVVQEDFDTERTLVNEVAIDIYIRISAMVWRGDRLEITRVNYGNEEELIETYQIEGGTTIPLFSHPPMDIGRLPENLGGLAQIVSRFQW